MSVTLSMEIELGWGSHDLTSFPTYISEDREEETKALKKILEICEEFDIRFSFDVVGHLFLEECDGHYNDDHPEGWFESDPGTSVSVDPEYYAPDLVDMIQRSPIEHEICTHTFSHALCNSFSNDALQWEIERVKKLHRAYCSRDPVSIVLPRHHPVDNSLLKEMGFKSVRKPFVNYKQPSSKPVKYFWKLSRSHPVADTREINGVVETYCTPHPSLTSPYLPNGRMNAHAAFRVLPLSIRQKLHRRYLVNGVDRAVRSGSNIHFWTHLYNIANEEQMTAVKPFFRYLSHCHESGKIDIKTMEELGSSI